MYIAMNRFPIAAGKEETFEKTWKDRERFLQKVDGFRSFQLLRGPEKEGRRVFISHSTWETEAAFLAWTESAAFRSAHGDARTPPGVVLGPPQFEGFEVILTD